MHILYHCPEPNDATSFYRGVGPLSCLRYLYPTITITPVTDLSWSVLAQCDILFLQRPYAQEHADLARIAKTLGKKLWIDYDDDLFNVPASHRDVYQLYRRDDVQHAISACLSWADVTTVTTEHLQSVYAEFTPRCVVLPNAYNDYWLPTALPTAPREKTIFWRGSVGHIADLAAFADDLECIAKKNPDWKWSFMGAVPWPLEGRIPNLEYRSATDIFTYHHIVRDVIRPAIMIAPLRDIPFNKGRSDSAWIEATSFGAHYCQSIHALDVDLSSYGTPHERLISENWINILNSKLLFHSNRQRIAILESLS